MELIDTAIHQALLRADGIIKECAKKYPVDDMVAAAAQSEASSSNLSPRRLRRKQSVDELIYIDDSDVSDC